MRALTAITPGVVVALAVALAPRAASAFHDARDFAAPAMEGGGAGSFFTGSPRFSSFDCTSCHTGAPGRAHLSLTSEPASLFETRRYVPGARTLVTIRLEDAVAGEGAAADRNSFAAEARAEDPAASSGALEPTDDRVELVDDARVAAPSPSFATGRAWTFAWTAPPPGAGVVWLHVAAVDGDGDASHTGDDVATTAVRLAELGGTQTPSPAGYHASCAALPGPGPACPVSALALVLLVVPLLVRPRRAVRRPLPAGHGRADRARPGRRPRASRP